MTPAALVVVLLLVALPRPAVGLIRVAPSLDWLCVCMPHIAIVEVSLPADTPGPAGVRALSHAGARTRRVLKGRPPAVCEVDCWGGVRLRPGSRTSLLAFLDEALEVKYAIAFDDSASCWDDPAISTDFSVLRSKQEILGVVFSRLERMRRDTLGSWRNVLVVDVPDRTAAFRRLCVETPRTV
jgi:hypothetical protein